MRLLTLRAVIERIDRLNANIGSANNDYNQGVFTLFGKDFFATNVVTHRNSDKRLMIHSMDVTYFDMHTRETVDCPELAKILIAKVNAGILTKEAVTP